MSKQNRGNFFEDFKVGQTLEHATPRTVTEADAALYTALYGARFVIDGAHQRLSCVTCHENQQFEGQDRHCANCHQEPDVHPRVLHRERVIHLQA